MARGRKKKKDPSLRRGREESAHRAARWNRLREIAGVGFVALTIAAIIALASFNAHDPSLNVATGSGAAHNYLGVFGAYFADLLVQLFGFGAWLFPVFAFGAAVLCFTRIAIGFAQARRAPRRAHGLLALARRPRQPRLPRRRPVLQRRRPAGPRRGRRRQIAGAAWRCRG